MTDLDLRRTIVTVDVEEWFHGHNYLSHVPPDTWDSQELRVRHGLSRCLDLLDRHHLTATFFVLGWTAERFPEVVQDIAQRGHEVACHSYAHPEVFKLTREAFREDCDRALTALDKAGIGQVRGYRAPSFSITPSVHDYLDILQDCGFAYDCSIFPIHHPRYGQPTSPRKPFRLSDDPGALVVVPMPTWRFFGVNVPYSGGGYLRLLPWPAFKLLRKLAWGQGVPCIVYLHPWELDDFKPAVGLSKANSLRSQGGQDTMPAKLERILSDGQFETLGQYVDRVNVGDRLPVQTLGCAAKIVSGLSR